MNRKIRQPLHECNLRNVMHMHSRRREIFRRCQDFFKEGLEIIPHNARQIEVQTHVGLLRQMPGLFVIHHGQCFMFIGFTAEDDAVSTAFNGSAHLFQIVHCHHKFGLGEFPGKCFGLERHRRCYAQRIMC